MRGFKRTTLVVAVILLTAQAFASPTTGGGRGDQGRLTVDVYLNGAGPFSFLVDTAATRSAVSQRIASKLDLADAGNAEVHDTHGRARVHLVHVDRLRIGNRVVANLTIPVLRSEDIGADGILGFDSFQGQRVSIDARRSQITITPAKDALPDSKQFVIRHISAVSHRAQMFITDADIDGQPVTVVVDSGASSSVINQRMKKMLGRRGRPIAGLRATLISATGSERPVEAMTLERLRVGEFLITDAPVAIADLDVFAELGLTDRPAMLLGMNLLKTFDRVDLDFQRRRVSFVVRPDAIQMGIEAQFALGNRTQIRPSAPLLALPPVAPPPTTTPSR